MYCEFAPDMYSTRNVSFQVWTFDWNTFSSKQQYNNVSWNQTCTFTKSDTEDVGMRIYNAEYAAYNRWVNYFKVYLSDPTLKKQWETAHLRTLNWLWFIDSFTTFGRHIDGTRITHE